MVHAGLDILRSDIRGKNAGSIVLDCDKFELIEQMFSASGSSIEILDDLLIYEHIDSGFRILIYLFRRKDSLKYVKKITL